MQFNLFGIFWIVLSIITFFKQQKYMGILFMFSFIFHANCIFIVGEQAISVSVFTGLILILKVLLTKPIIKNTKILRSWIIFFVFAICISLFSSYFFKGIPIFSEYIANGVNILITQPYDGSTGLYRFLILVIYIFSASMLPSCFEKMKFDEFIKWYKRILTLVLVVGILQYIIVLFNLPIYTLYEKIFATDITAFQSLTYYFRNPRLFSTFNEPSYCATFLIASFWSCFLIDKKYNLKIYLPFLLVEILLTRSTTAYVALIIGILIYLFTSKDIKAFGNIFVIVLGISILVFVTGIYKDIYSIIFEKATTNSGFTRSSWNKMAWQNFLDTNGIGMGYRTIRASSMFFNILGQLGIIGLCSFCYALWQSCKACYKSISKYFESKFAITFFMLVIVTQLIACPDLDNSILWFAISLCIYVSSLVSNNENLIKNIESYRIDFCRKDV